MSQPGTDEPLTADAAGMHAHMLRQFVTGRDVPCPGCGYNVRDLASDICPECGQQLVLSVRLGEPRQAALIAGLVGLSAGAGLGGLLLIYAAIIILIMQNGPSGLERFLVINAIGFAVHAAGVALWVRNWGRIRRVSSALRRLLVILCWALPLAYVVIFAAYIR